MWAPTILSVGPVDEDLHRRGRLADAVVGVPVAGVGVANVGVRPAGSGLVFEEADAGELRDREDDGGHAVVIRDDRLVLEHVRDGDLALEHRGPGSAAPAFGHPAEGHHAAVPATTRAKHENHG